jgi:hypothetical protein
VAETYVDGDTTVVTPGDNCASRTAHPYGDDVGIDIYHLDGTPTSDPSTAGGGH